MNIKSLLFTSGLCLSEGSVHIMNDIELTP